MNKIIPLTVFIALLAINVGCATIGNCERFGEGGADEDAALEECLRGEEITGSIGGGGASAESNTSNESSSNEPDGAETPSALEDQCFQGPQDENDSGEFEGSEIDPWQEACCDESQVRSGFPEDLDAYCEL